MDESTCSYGLCKNKFKYEERDVHFFKFGRYVFCPKCGRRIALIKYVHNDDKRIKKEHMSKKERLRLRKERKELVAMDTAKNPGL